MSYKFSKNLKLKKYYKEPEGEYDIISTVIFRLEENYKDMSNYYTKIFNLIDNFYEHFSSSFYFRLYFDNSIIKKSNNEMINNEIDTIWIPLLKKLKQKSFVQLCWYKHKDFRSNVVFHNGLFGTIIRFLPMFDYSFNKFLRTVVISDVDVSDTYLNHTKNCINYSKKHNLNFFFRTSFCKGNAGYHQTADKIVNTWLRIMAGTIVLNDYKFPRYILDNFFGQIHNKNYDNALEDFIKMDVFNIHSRKGKNYNIFRYGIDEFFAMYLLKHILDNKIKFGYLSSKDIDSPIYFYYRKNNEFLDNKPIYKEVLKKILGSYYVENKTLQQNYKYYEQTMYVFYTNKKPNEKQINLAKNTFKFFQEIKDNDLYDYYGFSKNDVKCVLFQKDKIDLNNNDNNNYYINDYNAV